MDVRRSGMLSTLAFRMAVVVPALAAGGCPLAGPLPSGGSGLTGTTFAYGCGTVQDPPSPTHCADAAPIQATFVIRAADHETEVARVTSEPDGTFRVPLSPGTYWIREVGTLVVDPGGYTEVHVGYPRG